MGQASWVAIKGADLDAVLQRFGLTQTGQVDYRADADLAAAETPGWVVVTAHAFDYVEGRLGALSTDAEVVTGQCSDVVMYSAARGYTAGSQTWSVVHDPAAGPNSLAVEGSPPAEFVAIRDRLMSQQAERGGDAVDYVYEVPMVLAAALCGYSPEAGVAPETVLKVVEPLRSGKAGERQAQQRAVRDALAAGVAAELFPLAERLGFERSVHHPALQAFYRFGASHALVRPRGEWSESIEIRSDLSDGAPRVAVDFFVRRGGAPRYGRSGTAFVPASPPSLMERFQGRRPAQPEDVANAIDIGRELLNAVDRHLREGTPHPNVRPAIYRDDLGDPGDHPGS
jgi:hypothetical protein